MLFFSLPSKGSLIYLNRYIFSEPFSSRDVFITECALLAVRPRYLPLRLFSVDTEHNGKKSMFLSACWGLIADIGWLYKIHLSRLVQILLASVFDGPGLLDYI